MTPRPLRYAGSCSTCGTRVEAGTIAWYDKTTKVTCTSCRPTDQMQLASPTAVLARSDREQGAALEQEIAEVFRSHGYQVSTNVIRNGKSGAPHEIDVLATKRDALIEITVGIECKAWKGSIEKDVVTKLYYAKQELGLGVGIVVALGGARSGALAAADQLGIIVWGPDEIERHLGKLGIAELQNRPTRQEIALPRHLDAAAARALVEKEAGGRLGMGKETVVWSGDAWLPASIVQFAISRDEGLVRKQIRTLPCWCIYELVAGSFVLRVMEKPVAGPVAVEVAPIPARLRLSDPEREVTRAMEKLNNVRTDSAIAKYRGQLTTLGIPDTYAAIAESSTPVLYPVHIAIATQRGTERVLAVDAFESVLDRRLGTVLTPQIGWIRESLSR